MTEEVDIDRLNSNGLVEYYNQLNPDNPIKRFSSRADGIKRIRKLLDEAPVVDLSHFKKAKESMTATDAQTAVPPEAATDPNKKPRKEREKRVPVDMKLPETTLNQARNRKEIVTWHAHNPMGLLAKWTEASHVWAHGVEGREAENAPGQEAAAFIRRYGNLSTWPKTNDVRSNLEMCGQAIEDISSECD